VAWGSELRSRFFNGWARLGISLAPLVIGCMLVFVSWRAWALSLLVFFGTGWQVPGTGSKIDRQTIPPLMGTIAVSLLSAPFTFVRTPPSSRGCPTIAAIPTLVNPV